MENSPLWSSGSSFRATPMHKSRRNTTRRIARIGGQISLFLTRSTSTQDMSTVKWSTRKTCDHGYFLVSWCFLVVGQSLGADVGVVGLVVVDLVEDGDDGLRELVYLHVPPLQDVDARLWWAAAQVEEDASFFQVALDEVDGPLQLRWGQAIQGSLLEDAVDTPVWPLLGDIHSFPPHPSFEVPFLALLLVDQGPAEVGADEVLVAPAVEGVHHCTFPAAQFQYPGMGVYKLTEEVFEKWRLNVPVIDLLLFELVAGIPIALNIVIREILWEAVFDEELLVLAEFGQFYLLLHSITRVIVLQSSKGLSSSIVI